jgi:tetratricopeptide (TPR) repeat protein
MSLSLLGILAAERRAWGEAEAWLRQALALREREGNLRKITSNLLNLAFCLERQARPAEARAAYERTVALLEDVPDATLQIGARLNLGIFLDNGGDPAAALAHYAHAETLALQAADPLHLARIHNNRAHALLHLGRPAEAAAACRQSAEHYARLGDDAARLDVLDTLAQAHRAAGELAAARAVLAAALAEAAPRRAEPAFARLHDLLAGHLAELEEDGSTNPIASGVSTGG